MNTESRALDQKDLFGQQIPDTLGCPINMLGGKLSFNKGDYEGVVLAQATSFESFQLIYLSTLSVQNCDLFCGAIILFHVMFAKLYPLSGSVWIRFLSQRPK